MVISLSACNSGIHSSPEKIANEFLDCISDGKTSELNELFYTTDSVDPDSYFEEFYELCKIGYGDNYKISFSDVTVSDIDLDELDSTKNFLGTLKGIDTSRPIDDYKQIDFKWSITGALDSILDKSHSFLAIKEDENWYIHDSIDTFRFTLAIMSSTDNLDGVLD